MYNSRSNSPQLTPPPWMPYLQTGFYYLGFIALGLSTASLGPTLQGLALHTHTNLGEISFLFTARSLGYLVGSSQIGRLYDRLRGHYLMSAGLFGMALMLALVPLIPLLWVLTIVLFFLGASEGLLDVGENTLLVWIHQKKVGPFMNGLHFFFGIGSFLSPVIIAFMVLNRGDITWAYWAIAVLMLPAAIGMLFLPSPRVSTSTHAEGSLRIQPAMIGLLVVMFFLFVGAESSFGGWIFTYTVRQKLAGETSAAYLTSAFWGALTAGRLIGIPIASRFHPRWILLGDLVVCVLGSVIALLNPNSLLATWTSTILVGFGIASMFPAALALAQRSMPISAKVTTWFFVGSSLGGMALPWLIGQLIEPIGAWSMMAVLLGDLLIAIATLGILLRLIGPSPEPVRSQLA